MDNTTAAPSSTDARAQLEATEALRLTSPHDRRVHALATAGFGLAVGAVVVLQQVAEGTSAETWVYVVYVVYGLVLVALATWQSRGARTVPRHSKRVGRWGLAGTAFLALSAIGILGARSGEAEFAGQVGWQESWWVLVLAALVVAAPMLVAGHLIDRSRS